MTHIKELMNGTWSSLIEWNICPIFEVDLSGTIVNSNLAARAQFKLPKDDGILFTKVFIELMSNLMHSKNDIVVLVRELAINTIIYDTYAFGFPALGRIFIHMIDITHRKKIEKELFNLNKELEQRVNERTSELKIAKEKAEEMTMRAEEANRLKSNFLANMSHELRTPLNAIVGFADLMHRGSVGPVSTEHKEYLADILTSSKHLLHLINDILELSKIEAGIIEFHTQRINLPDIVKEVFDSLKPLVDEKSLIVSQDIDAKLKYIVIDGYKFKQILYNYLSNAIKFSKVSGEIQVKITVEDSNKFKLAVKDFGIGILKEDLKKLFTDFQQLDNTLTKKYQGTGLGLALTKRLVEAQGGKVGVESEYGTGSIFYAILPRRS